MKIPNVLKILLIASSFMAMNLKAQELTESNLSYLQSLPQSLQSQFLSRNEMQDQNTTPILKNDEEEEKSEEQDFDDVPQEEQKFGFSYFEEKPKQLVETYNDIPLMSDYRLSLNDEIEITVSGSKKAVYRKKINLGGSIQIPEIGEITLNGLTLSEANLKINEIISEYYVGAKSVVSIAKASLKRISVIGSVKEPGTYLVNPYVTVSQAIKYAGGLTDNASLRTIEVVDYEGKKIITDLYSFLIFGDRRNDTNLQNGDTVLINSTSNYLKIYGAVHRPMQYEYLADDTFKDLINFAQGATKYSDTSELFANIARNQQIISQKVSVSDSINNEMVESLLIPSRFFISDKDIEIRGNGVMNKMFPNKKFATLGDLIQNLKFSQDIYPFIFTLEQSTPNGLVKETVSLSLADPQSYESLELKSNVILTFYSREDYENFNADVQIKDYLKEEKEEKKLLKQNLIKMESNDFVDNQNPINQDDMPSDPSFTYEPEYTEEDFILDEKLFTYFMDNSIKIKAGETLVYVPMNGRFIPKNVVNYINLVGGYDYKKMSLTNAFGSYFTNVHTSNFRFSPGTALSLPLEAVSSTINVEIAGEVLFPGSYELNKNASLNDLYNIAGGFTSKADQNGIFFSRASIKKKEKQAFDAAKKLILDLALSNASNPLLQQTPGAGIDKTVLALIDSFDSDSFQGRLAGDLKLNSYTSKTTILQDQDFVVIPSLTNTVAVIGEVLSPTSLVLNENYDLYDYIEESGGFTRFADKRNMYIIKSDGTSIKANGSLFQNQYNLSPGDTIVVPRNLEKTSLVPLVSIATKVISDLAFAAASINALNN